MCPLVQCPQQNPAFGDESITKPQKAMHILFLADCMTSLFLTYFSSGLGAFSSLRAPVKIGQAEGQITLFRHVLVLSFFCFNVSAPLVSVDFLFGFGLSGFLSRCQSLAVVRLSI